MAVTLSPMALNVHCAAHSLNLFMSKSSKVTRILKSWGNIIKIQNYFHHSS